MVGRDTTDQLTGNTISNQRPELLVTDILPVLKEPDNSKRTQLRVADVYRKWATCTDEIA